MSEREREATSRVELKTSYAFYPQKNERTEQLNGVCGTESELAEF